MKALATALLVIAVWACLSARMTAESAPVSLFSSKAFRLTLREDKNSNLPFSPGCSDEARMTLACRAFVLELENLSKYTVQLINPSCNEPSVTLEERRVAQTGTEDWVEISAANQHVCNALVRNRFEFVRARRSDIEQGLSPQIAALHSPDGSLSCIHPERTQSVHVGRFRGACCIRSRQVIARQIQHQ